MVGRDLIDEGSLMTHMNLESELLKLPYTRSDRLKITMISLHGLIRAHEPELGRDADTGGQIKYVLELARELSAHPSVAEVELLTRQVVDPSTDDGYATSVEQIAENARIVRIPFGPRRYLRKESLWPYLEVFIDETLNHFRRCGLPDIIHGHYADAGLAGAQLARLLHIPFVFTGHSLGRVKQHRLSLEGNQSEGWEKKYRFGPRIEAEEIALETASMVVTSTHQEVEQQYQMYDHYVPGRMDVIPPGVDLTQFTPVWDPASHPEVADRLEPFLRDPDKPMILAVARPDERKNLERLVQVYGQSPELQSLANLVLIMGVRDDLRELPKAQMQILNKVLYWIDRFDLYGKVAYPKAHRPQDIPALYQLAARQQGVFVNPAYTEPFGLTLLEAAATGLPIVATNDGGPRDIVANCQNGRLIDPLDSEDIERALVEVLSDSGKWQRWSEQGIEGTRQHYSWARHAERYLEDLRTILSTSPPPVLASVSSGRRLTDFNRLIVTDLDNTLTGDDESLGAFVDMIRENDQVGFGVATGRKLDSALELIEQLGLPQPDLMDTDVGTQLHYGENLTPDRTWQKSIAYAWKPEEIRQLLDEVPGLFPQAPACQSQFKISYDVDPDIAPTTRDLKRMLRAAGLRAKVVFSLGMYLDIIPVRGGSGLSMRHVLWKWGFSPDRVLVAGDSGNDVEMLLGRTLGVVVGNHSPELNRLKNRPRIYFAKASHAAGIMEGIDYYHFLEDIVIPNES